MFTCAKCRRPLKVDFDKPIHESTLVDIQSALNKAASASAASSSSSSSSSSSPPSSSSASPSSSIASSSSSTHPLADPLKKPPLSNASSSSSLSSNAALSRVMNELTDSFIVLPAATSSSASASSSSSSTANHLHVPHVESSHLPQRRTNNVSSIIATSSNMSSSPSSNSTLTPDRQFQTLSNIIELVADKCDYDQPLCMTCSNSVLEELETRIREVESDREVYRSFLAKLSTKSSDTSTATNSNNSGSVRVSEEESELVDRLSRIEAERRELANELRILDRESADLVKHERLFWHYYQDAMHDLHSANDEMSAVRQQIKVSNETLERLKRTNVYDDAFHISYDGHFGTINGFRLGKMASANPSVDWIETNAGLGQVVLLLHTVARLTGYKFNKYRLIANGSFSKMAEITSPPAPSSTSASASSSSASNDKKDQTTYELYGSNDLSLGRLFWYRRFDTALVWLLQCIKELQDYAYSIDKRFKPKYTIKGDLIGDISIKLQFNNDARWTKALKYMLTNCKFLLLWLSQNVA